MIRMTNGAVENATAKSYIYKDLIALCKDKDTVPTTELLKTVANALVDLEVKRQVQEYYVATLREGLSFYLPGPFWETVVVGTKADADAGKHAEWVLRLTEEGAT